MNITNSDLEFLIKLENKLGSTENWSEDVIGLWEMIEKLKAQKARSNEKIRNNIREKRKSDPGYGRSKQEKEKINKKIKEVQSMENNTKIMTVVYADNIGLVLQGGVTEIITMQDTGHDDGDTILRTEGRKNIFVHTNGLRTITGCCKLFITVQRTENMTDTYAVDPYDEISFCDGKMYFADVFSGEDRVENINDLVSIKTEL